LEQFELNQLRQNGNRTGGFCFHKATLFTAIRYDDNWDATGGFFAPETLEQPGQGEIACAQFTDDQVWPLSVKRHS